MPRSAARLVTALLVAGVGMYLGISLGVYAEADDSPGGVVIGIVLMFGSLALGTWIALRRRDKPTANGG